MEFNKHPELNGKHSYLSPSQYSWLNYEEGKMKRRWMNEKKKEEGTYLHEMASMMIKTHTEAADITKAIYLFVNDAIGFRMHSEVVLRYSDNAFGTADAISFDAKKKILRIHDLKTGTTKPSFKQLDIYAAYFCLEYGIDPTKITVIERLYQGMGYVENIPAPVDIKWTMERVIAADAEVNEAIMDYKGPFS